MPQHQPRVLRILPDPVSIPLPPEPHPLPGTFAIDLTGLPSGESIIEINEFLASVGDSDAANDSSIHSPRAKHESAEPDSVDNNNSDALNLIPHPDHSDQPPSKPFVFPQTIGFPLAKDRDWWLSKEHHLSALPFAADMTTFAAFLKSPQTGRNVRLAFFATPTENTLGYYDDVWDVEVHYWVAALIRGGGEGGGEGGDGDTDGGETHVVIWDYDAFGDVDWYVVHGRPVVGVCVLRGHQARFVARVRKKEKVSSVWVNEVGEIRILEDIQKVRRVGERHMLWWLRLLVGFGDRRFMGEEDPRVHGCVQVPNR